MDLRAEVPWAQDGMYFARNQQSLELRWQVRCAMGDVQVPDAQNEHHFPGPSECSHCYMLEYALCAYINRTKWQRETF